MSAVQQLPSNYWASSLDINRPALATRDPSGDSRTQLFVGNLPYRIRWQDLKDLFRKCGTVLRADVALTAENRSKGFGTVLYQSDRDAMRAIETFHRSVLAAASVLKPSHPLSFALARSFNWQGRVLDVRLDQQDPTGAIALAMASGPQPQNNSMNGPGSWPGHLHPSPYGSPMMHPSSTPPHLPLPGSMPLQPAHTISRPNSAASNKASRSGSFNKSTELSGSTSEAGISAKAESQVSDSHSEAGAFQGAPNQSFGMSYPQGNGPMYLPYGYTPPVHGGLMSFYHPPSVRSFPTPSAKLTRSLATAV
jgi:RNA recognition motif-containing protein